MPSRTAPRLTYREMLLDPRWQRKRLHVLEAHGWACDSCNAKERTLHVHHKVYWPGCAPWEYESGWLSVLCDQCHEEETLDAKEDRVTRAAEGIETDFHKRIFRLLPTMTSPGETEDLLVDLLVLDGDLVRAGLTPGVFALLHPLQTGEMPLLLAEAVASWEHERAHQGSERQPFELHLLRVLSRTAKPKPGSAEPKTGE